MDKFTHLHCHSEYSLLDGFGHPQQFIEVVKSIGQPAIALTDHGSVSGHFKWYEACRKENIKPILGCELYVADAIGKKERLRYHLTVLARTNEGLRNLNQLVSQSWNEGFYYKPRVDWELLKRYAAGLIVTSSCPSGKTGWLIKNNADEKQLMLELKRQKGIFEHFFVEIAPWDYAEGKLIAKSILKAATKLKIPVVATMDCHYPKSEDADSQDVMLCIQTGARHADQDRMRFEQKDFYVKDRSTMERDLKRVIGTVDKKWLDNSVKIAEMVETEFPKAKPLSFSHKGNKVKLFHKLCSDGMKRRKLAGKKEYEKRLKYEFDLIVQKDFVDYFLVVIDLVVWAKDNGIMLAPARGSSCGSLVCYLTRITEVDPLPFGLLFERFIDMNRTDLPDIDIDFEDERRNEVKQYLETKYGKDYVATLATFGTFKGKSCLQDIGKVFNIPWSVVDDVKKLVVQRSGGDSRASFTVDDTFTGFDSAVAIIKQYPQFHFAGKIEGQIRHRGQHAAGLVISNEPITNFAAFYQRKDGEQTMSMDYHDASSIGLLKIDLLGVTSMSVIRRAVDAINGRNKKKKLDMMDVPFDDQKVLKSFREGKLFGVFQFDGHAMQGVCRQMQPQTFNELIAINALARPGSLNSGGTSDYYERKVGIQPITYDHPLLEPILKDTFGIPIYQEQVMMIVRVVGRFEWSGVGTVRKMMTKRVGVEQFETFWQQFKSGAAKNGVDEPTARRIWDRMCTFGSWAFNKSHSVAYTIVGYWMMWLKVHHPIEFYCALLERESAEDKIRRIIKEYVADGGTLLPPHINRSKKGFSIDGKGLRVGFRNIKGVGDNLAEKIETHQPYISVWDIKARVKREATINTMFSLGALDGLPIGFKNNTPSLFGDDDGMSKVVKTDEKEQFIAFHNHCPVMIQRHYTKDWKEWVERNTVIDLIGIDELDARAGEPVAILGTVLKETYNLKNKAQEAIRKGNTFELKGKPQDHYNYILFDVEDEVSFVKCWMGHKNYPRFSDLLWNKADDEPMLVWGTSQESKSGIFFADAVWSLKGLKERVDGKKPNSIDDKILRAKPLPNKGVA